MRKKNIDRYTVFQSKLLHGEPPIPAERPRKSRTRAAAEDTARTHIRTLCIPQYKKAENESIKRETEKKDRNRSREREILRILTKIEGLPITRGVSACLSVGVALERLPSESSPPPGRRGALSRRRGGVGGGGFCRGRPHQGAAAATRTQGLAAARPCVSPPEPSPSTVRGGTLSPHPPGDERATEGG